MPEVRRWPLELDGHLCRTRQLPLRQHHPAFLLFSAEHVLQDQPLLRRNVGSQGQQSAVRAYDQGVGALIERRPLPRHPVNHNRHVHRQTLAAPLASPPSSGSSRRFPHGTFSIAPIRRRGRPHCPLVPNQIILPIGSAECPISRHSNPIPGQKPIPRSSNSILRLFPRITCRGLASALRLPSQQPCGPGPEPPDRGSSRWLFDSRKPQESARPAAPSSAFPFSARLGASAP